MKEEREPRLDVEEETDLEEESTPEHVDYRSRLMEILISLPPDGFERLCQRLLRESGFQQVNVTGKTGDGGLDGNSLLQVNPFVSFQALALMREAIRQAQEQAEEPSSGDEEQQHEEGDS